MSSTCQDCGRPSKWHLARGRCRGCYPKYIQRLKDAGEYQKMPGRPAVERVLARAVPAWGGCIIWTGSTSEGYGRIGDSGANKQTHRVVYETLIGPIPAGLQLDHLCHTESATCAGGVQCLHRRCVNPLHLEPVTVPENNRRSLNPINKNILKTHCAQGHEYTKENTYRASTGQRVCRECQRIRARQRDRSKPKVERTHCQNGHPRNDADAYLDAKGRLNCGECRRESSRRYKERKRTRKTE